MAHQSPRWPLREGIRALAKASQDNSTPVTDFARDLLRAVQQAEPPHMLRSGNGSRVLPLMSWLLPKGLLDKKLRQRFGLDKKL